jgi:hypothetical protein
LYLSFFSLESVTVKNFTLSRMSVKSSFTDYRRNSPCKKSVKLRLLQFFSVLRRTADFFRNSFPITSKRSAIVSRSKRKIIFTICNQMSSRNRLKPNPDQGSFPESKVEKNQGKNVQNVPPPNIPSLKSQSQNVSGQKRSQPPNVKFYLGGIRLLICVPRV